MATFPTRTVAAAAGLLALIATLVLVTGGDATAAGTSIEARDNFFAPTSVTVEAGDTITWKNTGAITHNVTSGGDLSTEADDGALFDQDLPSGQSFSYTAEEPGTIAYFCRFHGTQSSGMSGTITVTPSTAASAGRLSGEDRFETAVRISQYAFPGGADEVYLARADAFADALAGSALTKGPVLLVPSCGEVPKVVLDEAARLNPSKVIALGGKAAVCDQVLTGVRDAAS